MFMRFPSLTFLEGDHEVRPLFELLPIKVSHMGIHGVTGPPSRIFEHMKNPDTPGKWLFLRYPPVSELIGSGPIPRKKI